MPRGRSRKNPEQDGAGQTQSAQAPTDATDFEGQAAAIGGPPEDEMTAPAQAGSELEGQPDTLLGYIAESVKDDVREFMRMFGIEGHQPEEVWTAIQGIAAQAAQHQVAQPPQLSPDRDPDWPQNVAEYFEYFQLDTHPEEMVADFITMLGVQTPELQSAYGQEQGDAPAGDPISLSVRITSLEMDGDTRAFATAEYGDLTISRIRVKEDGYGTLSVNMPKYRTPEGWRETCRFEPMEARNRLTSATLEAYHQKLAQLQGQAQEQGSSAEQTAGDAALPGQGMDEMGDPDLNEQEQGGFGMSMSQ